MKISMIKMAGGALMPASDMEADKLTKFKSGELYEVEIKLSRSPTFHRKVFAFFNFCFEHWSGDNEFQSEARQFDIFRQNLTVLAGFYDTYHTIKGSVRVEAKSLAFSSMTQEEFQECYSALINAAIKHIFKGDESAYYDQLIGFF